MKGELGQDYGYRVFDHEDGLVLFDGVEVHYAERVLTSPVVSELKIAIKRHGWKIKQYDGHVGVVT